MEIIIDRYFKLYIVVIILYNMIDNLLLFCRVHQLCKIPRLFGFIDGIHYNIVRPTNSEFVSLIGKIIILLIFKLQVSLLKMI